jgi:acyl-homoserine lactone synthase
MQVHLVDSENSHLYRSELKLMFRRRHEVFIRDKGWRLKATPSDIGELEIDEFDQIDAVEYLLMLDENRNLMGSTRILPTTGPHLCNGPLDNYFEPKRHPGIGPKTWEVSRGITAPSYNHHLMALCNAILAAGIIEWALYRGVTRIISVMDQRLVGAMLATGWQITMCGSPVNYDEGGTGVAITWPVDQSTLDTTREICSIHGPVLVHHQAEPLRAAQ